MVAITRKELYEKIWSIGTSKTAKELDIPYNKLKSACITNDIPLPTQSYWSSLQLGKVKPTQPLLPDPNDNPTITFEKTKAKSKIPEKILVPKNKQKLEATIKESTIPTTNNEVQRIEYFSYFSSDEQLLLSQTYESLKVNKTLSSKPHQEIVKYRKKDTGNYSYYNREPKLIINSSSGVIIPEALPFIDSLFKALEKVGAKIHILRDETQVLYNSYIFTLAFRLPSNKVQLNPDDKEYSSYNTFKYISTGKLNVEVGYRLEWIKRWKHEKLIKQTSKDTIDDLLKKVFRYIFSLPQKIDEENKAHEIEEERRRKEEEQRAILKELHDNEYERTEELLKRSMHHFYSQIMRKYIESEMQEGTDEYNWALEKSNWMKDSDRYSDPILTKKDKEKLFENKSNRSFFSIDF